MDTRGIVTKLRANPAQFEQADILANFVAIIPSTDRVVYKYRVDFDPEVESQSKKRFLFRAAARELFTRMPIYDGVHECRSGQFLEYGTTTTTVNDPREEKDYVVKLTNTGTSTYGSEFTRTYNMQMKEFLRILGFYQLPPGLMVHPNHDYQIGTEIVMVRGFRTSANVHDGKHMLMNLEAAHKFVQKQNVLTLMENLRATARGTPLPTLIGAALIGKTVVTLYNKLSYRIEDIDFGTRPTSSFDRSGVPTTYVDYYQSVHNITIRTLTQPLLKAVPNNQRRRDEESGDTLLVPELCNIAGLTDSQKNDIRFNTNLNKASQMVPSDQVRHLREFVQSFHMNEEIKEQLSNWGYSYGRDLCKIKAHVLPMTGYASGDTCRDPLNAYPKADLKSADIRLSGLAVVPNIKKMVIITAKNQLRDRRQIIDNLRDGFMKMKLKPEKVEVKDIPDGDSANHYISTIRSLTPDTTVAIVIMQQQNKERYDAIKKAASCEKGLITQVVTAKLMLDPRKFQSAALKIAIQVAAKVGGEPWWVDIPLKRTMICGYDTYHDTAKRGRSFGAFVASLNYRYTRWWSKADAYERLDEVSSQMSVNIVEALKCYRKYNNDELPERVIIYREGVGDGQLNHVNEVEVKKIREVLARVAPHSKLTMVIVNKRVGARFYMQSGADGSFLNPPPGTIIDHTVTREGRYDFYLISQSTRQGTVTPTYYNIIHDESKFSPDIHQKLAFKLCLLYNNWSGTVRVPAPCKYAHKLALLCGEHLHSQPNACLCDKLHFL